MLTSSAPIDLRTVPTPGSLFGFGPQLMVVHSKEPPGPSGVDALRSYHHEMQAKHHDGYLYVVLVGEQSTPAGEQRAVMSQIMREIVDSGGRVGLVLEATGFVGAVQRSIATTFSRLVAQKGLRIFATPTAAAAWLAEGRETWTEDALASTLIEFAKLPVPPG